MKTTDNMNAGRNVHPASRILHPAFCILLLLGLMLFQFRCTPDKTSASADQYTCPMHPTVISDKQGSCPVCGMDLVRKGREGEEVKMTGELAKTLTAPNKAVLASVRTLRGVYESKDIIVTAKGIVTYDTRYIQVLAARMAGRLESVYIKYIGQAVQQGERVAEVYSPELETAERELIFLIEQDGSNAELIAASKQKLSLLGVSKGEIEELQKSKSTDGRFTLFSPTTGFAVESESGAGLLREGEYLSSGQTLFRIASRRALRMELNVPAPQAAGIRVGDPIEISSDDGRTFRGKVDFIQPLFSEGEAFQKIRVYDQRADLRIGQLVSGTIHEKAREAFWIPRESVVDLGVETIVFIKDRSGVFKPRPITLGVRSGNWVEVRQGLASAEEIAENAAFLVDTDGFISNK